MQPLISSFTLTHDSKLDVSMDLDTSNVLRVQFVLTSTPRSMSPEAFIHWGVTTTDRPEAWASPDQGSLPMTHFQWSEHLLKRVPGAVQSAFPVSTAEDGRRVIEFLFKDVTSATPPTELPRTIDFVVHFPPETWIKNGKSNFSIPVSAFVRSCFADTQLQEAVSSMIGSRIAKAAKTLTGTYRWNVQGKDAAFILLNFVFSDHPDYCVLFFFTDTPHPLLLHWGSIPSPATSKTWMQADVRQLEITEPGQTSDNEKFASHPVDSRALQTEFTYWTKSGESPIQYLRLVIGAGAVPKQIRFVLKESKSNNWFQDQGLDFVMDIPQNVAYEQKRRELEIEEERRRVREAEERNKRESYWSDALEKFQSDCENRKLNGDVMYKHVVLSDGAGELDVVASFNPLESSIHVDFIGCLKYPLTLHWGVVGEAGQRQRFAAVQQWSCPIESYRPTGSIVIDPKRSCESPLSIIPYNLGMDTVETITAAEKEEKQEKKKKKKEKEKEKKKDGAIEKQNLIAPFFQGLTIRIPGKRDPPGSEFDSGVIPEVPGIACVLRETNGSRWFKAKDNSDIVVRLVSLATGAWTGELPEVIDDIMAAEIGWHHMTLFHRYNLINGAVSRWNDDQAKSDQPLIVRSWTSLFRPAGERSIMETPGQTVPLRTLKDSGSVLPGRVGGSGGERTYNLNCEFWSWMFVWSRFSYMGILDWQRNYNTKPSELSHATLCLNHKLATLWIRWPEYRPLIRLTLSTVARGGNQGQAIRDRILDLMHKHKIPENNANFYEQWHQKLHNNTTPDDIPICLAVIAYLRTHNHNDYWNTLTFHGITKERLASYERKIVAVPYMVQTDIGSLIHDLEQYLDILKDVHDSLDLKKAFDHAARYLPSDAIDIVRDVVNKTTVSGIALKGGKAVCYGQSADQLFHRFVQVSEGRNRVIYHLTRPNISPEAACELLFLDFALEQQQGLALQADNANNFSQYQLCKELMHMAINLSGHFCHHEELSAACRDWVQLSGDCVEGKFSSSSVESALMLKALSDRLSLILGGLVQQWQTLFGPKAEYLGQQIGADQKTLNVFVDEVLRGSILFGISLSLKRLEPKLREAAQLPPWQMISIVARTDGQLEEVDRLINIQDKVFEVPTILISGSVSGEEEIPVGVQAVLVRSSQESPDILSHVSVRARNAHVLLGVCFDPQIVEELSKLRGQWIELTVPSHGGDLKYTVIPSPSPDTFQRKSSKRLLQSFDRQRTQSDLDDLAVQGKKTTTMNLTSASSTWVIKGNEFSRSVVGSKSLNISTLRKSLPAEVVTPVAVALPYGCFQKTLNFPDNKSRVLEPLIKCLGQLKPYTLNAEAGPIFAKARQLVSELQFPPEFQQELVFRMKESNGTLLQLYEQWGPKASWKAICEVWGSLFGLRPWISLSKAGRQYHELNMAVLIQELLLANYAFVLHTKNPFDVNAVDEMYGEIVPGLGEVLVGNFPGRALSWRMKKNQDPVVVSFPSKQFALKGSPCLIFRSDSNGEDLEGFAGAGLFESITAEDNQKVILSYATMKLVNDGEYRKRLLKKIGDLAFLIEDVFKTPMDIEGVVLENETLGVVQARPQVF